MEAVWKRRRWQCDCQSCVMHQDGVQQLIYQSRRWPNRQKRHNTLYFPETTPSKRQAYGSRLLDITILTRHYSR